MALFIKNTKYNNKNNKTKLSFLVSSLFVVGIFASMLIIATSKKTKADTINSTDFVTTWKVEAGDTEITIPTNPSYTSGTSQYNYNVFVNGTQIGTNVAGDFTHDFGAAGEYQVRINGDFPAIYLGYTYSGQPGHNDTVANAAKLVSIDQWGDNAWKSMRSAFRYAVNMQYRATDIPDLSNVNNAINMFAGATAFDGDLSSWDVSSVDTFTGMFNDATSFNGNISSWDVSSATQMNFMFDNASSFNRNLGSWDISNLTAMEGMFDRSGLSTANYDATLAGWASQSVTPNAELGATDLKYCNTRARNILTNTPNSWTISGDTFTTTDCSHYDFTINTGGKDITSGAKEIDKRPTFTGSYLPGWDVEIEVNSTPVFCNTTVNLDGTWSCTLPSDLEPGNHKVYVRVSYLNDNTTEFGPYDVSVLGGSTGAPVVTGSDKLEDGESKPSSLNNTGLQLLIGYVMSALIAVISLVLYRKTKVKNYSTQ